MLDAVSMCVAVDAHPFVAILLSTPELDVDKVNRGPERLAMHWAKGRMALLSFHRRAEEGFGFCDPPRSPQGEPDQEERPYRLRVIRPEHTNLSLVGRAGQLLRFIQIAAPTQQRAQPLRAA